MINYDEQIIALLSSKNNKEQILNIIDQWRIHTLYLEDELSKRDFITNSLKKKIKTMNYDFNNALDDMDDGITSLTKENAFLKKNKR
jgi:LPS O-antigen subunit length determinant protein (WzzB/FepE family)